MSFTKEVKDAVWLMVETHFKEKYLINPDKPTFDITMDKLRVLFDALGKAMEEK